MLKKMRLRLILAAMLAFSAVIGLIAVLVNVINYQVVTGRADQTLSYISGYEKRLPEGPKPEDPPMAPFMALPDVEANYMTRFFFVRFDRDGNVSSTSTEYIASISESNAAAYAEKAMNRKADRGYIAEYRYLKEAADDGTVIIFLNVSRELQFMNSLRQLTLFVAGGSLVLVLILIGIFSGRAIRPIARNIERQKQFITDASHELKTPLTSISTSLDVIELEHGEDEWTENIRKQTGRMSHLVSELVALSRLDEEIPLPNQEQFSLSNAAWEVAEVYQPQAKACNKNLTVDIEDNLTMNGDKPAIQQMMSVLLDNAVKYSDPGGDIRISVCKKRGRLRIDVFNTCQFDVPPDTGRMFDRFYRPDASRNAGTGGTGVGLAIAKAAAEAHGGRIAASCRTGNR